MKYIVNAFAIATLVLTLIAAYLVLGAWYLALSVVVFVAMVYAMDWLSYHVPNKHTKKIYIAWFVALGTVNITSTVLLWLAFGPATALFLVIGYYAALAIHAYREFIADKPRGATTTWI